MLQILEDDSPYPEVRCAVSNIDDPDMPVNTLRAWCLGIICAIIFPGLNVFMHFRWPSVGIGPVSALYFTYSSGPGADRVICATAGGYPPILSHWEAMGALRPRQDFIWSSVKPRSIHRQGTCHRHYHGLRWWKIFLCSEYIDAFFVPEIVLH